MEEGNAFEAGIVSGVENSRERGGREIRTRAEAADIVEPDHAQVARNLIFRVEDSRHQTSRRFSR
jgi:hypothetical protein